MQIFFFQRQLEKVCWTLILHNLCSHICMYFRSFRYISHYYLIIVASNIWTDNPVSNLEEDEWRSFLLPDQHNFFHSIRMITRSGDEHPKKASTSTPCGCCSAVRSDFFEKSVKTFSKPPPYQPYQALISTWQKLFFHFQCNHSM